MGVDEEIEAAEAEGNVMALVGIVRTLVDAADGEGEVEVEVDTCEEALSALYRLAVDRSAFDIGVEGEARAAETMRVCLRTLLQEPSALEVVLGCVRCFAAKNPGMQAALCSPETVTLLVRGMREHEEGEETVQEQGCLVVAALAENNPANVAVLTAEGSGVEAAVRAAAGIISNERNKRYPTVALEALGLAV